MTPSNLNGRYDQAVGYIFDISDSEIETSQNAVYFLTVVKMLVFSMHQVKVKIVGFLLLV